MAGGELPVLLVQEQNRQGANVLQASMIYESLLMRRTYFLVPDYGSAQAIFLHIISSSLCTWEKNV